MRLPADWCRCHDRTCPDRHRCLRWLERGTGMDWTPAVATLRKPGQPQCLKFLLS